MKHVHFCHLLESNAMHMKDGRFSYREIVTYVLDIKYPSGFCKADKLAL